MRQKMYCEGREIKIRKALILYEVHDIERI